MSTPGTGRYQLRRLQSLGLKVRLLPALRDVDTPADAAAVAALAPHTRFARLHRRLTATALAPMVLYDEALAGGAVEVLEGEGADARSAILGIARWRSLSPADEILVARCEPPVLDVGCGPGRLVEAAAVRGMAAMGIDLSAAAVEQTAARGASVLRRAVEERLPSEGRWGSVLLADGNIGIGGDVPALLSRCHQLLRPGGVALVEADPDDQVHQRSWLRLRSGARTSTPLPWARVGTHALVRIANALGFVAVEHWRVEGRVFVSFRKAA
jgi:SAM-dependent methyltransferase